MGEVYRAKDTHLDRSVAIKVLPESFALDADRVARFTREAKTLAALNHPNIAGIYGLEKATDFTALVMELVEGEDLSAHIARGAIALGEALPIARQIAEALEAAHEQGIIHRDLKPANIKVRADGTVKVLDFGLAKALGPEGASATADAMHSPTLTARATQMGMILGTAAYMAPEQARGKAVDRRADVWAFGAVLFEMLTGARAFPGDDITDTLAAVVRAEPDWNLVPQDVSPTRLAFLKRCLQKDPKQRLGDIRDMRLALEGAFDTAAPQASAPAAPAASRGRVGWGAAAVFALLAAVAGAWALRPIPTPPETRLDITTPSTDDPTAFAISPDGRQLVFLATAAGGQSQLWLRRLDQTTPVALAWTEGAEFPFWSPDSRSVAFFNGQKLERLDIGSGRPQTLVTIAGAPRGGSWSPSGVIVVGQVSGPLVRVPVTGGAPADVTHLEQNQNSHRFPCFLPGGRQFLFYVLGGSAAGLYLGSLDSPDTRRIADTDTNAQFVAPDWLLFVRQGALLAQHVDLARGQLTGEPLSVADPVAVNATLALAALSVSPAGSITYRNGHAQQAHLTWFDRAGKPAGTIQTSNADVVSLQPTLSPDGHRVAVYRTTQGNTDVWLLDAGRETRLTFDAGREAYPVWSPDGSRIAFGNDLNGAMSLFQKPSIGAGAEDVLLRSSGDNHAQWPGRLTAST
jgi:hypothetical protein